MGATAALAALTLVLLAGREGGSQQTLVPAPPAHSPTGSILPTTFTAESLTPGAAKDGPDSQERTKPMMHQMDHGSDSDDDHGDMSAVTAAGSEAEVNLSLASDQDAENSTFLPAHRLMVLSASTSRSAPRQNSSTDLVDVQQNVDTDESIKELNCTHSEKLSCSFEKTGMQVCGNHYPKHCSCDALCMVNRDCCVDFPSACPAVHEKAEAIKRLYPGAQAECGEHGGIVIGSCREGNSEHGFLHELCIEGPGGNYLPDFSPMWDRSSGLNFKNFYCAICNGAAEENLVPWNLTIKTPNKYRDIESLRNLLDQLISKLLDLGKAEKILGWTALTARRCDPAASQECPSTAGPLAALCQAYMTSLVFGDDLRNPYRNKYCLACNGGVRCRAVVGAPESIHTFSTIMLPQEQHGEIEIVGSGAFGSWEAATCEMSGGPLACRVTQCKTDHVQVDGACLPTSTSIRLLLDMQKVTGLDECSATDKLWSLLVKPGSSEGSCAVTSSIVLNVKKSLQDKFSFLHLWFKECEVVMKDVYLMYLSFSHQPSSLPRKDVDTFLVEAEKKWVPAIFREIDVCGIVGSSLWSSTGEEFLPDWEKPRLYTRLPCGDEEPELGGVSPPATAPSWSALLLPALLLPLLSDWAFM